jgi:hypothetical protein
MVSQYAQELTRVSVLHVRYLGESALRESFDVTVQQIIHKRDNVNGTTLEPEIIVNDYIIDGVEVEGQISYSGAVIRFSLDKDEEGTFEPMTEYDTEILFDTLQDLDAFSGREMQRQL